MTVTDESLPTDNHVAVILAAYKTHAGSAYAVALRVTRNHELAAEAVQEAFLCLWRTKTAFRPDRGDIGPFLHTIVHRRAVDMLRQLTRHPTPLPLDFVASELRSIDLGPEDHACRGEEFERVRIAVMALPAGQRQPLVLAHYYGLTQSDVAERLGLPLGTVKSRIRAARRDLRAVLSAEMCPSSEK